MNKLRELLKDLCERMERARSILSDGGNWSMLDTTEARAILSQPEADPRQSAANTGHGHVNKRPDGVLSRCGGPGICKECSADLARKYAKEPAPHRHVASLEAAEKPKKFPFVWECDICDEAFMTAWQLQHHRCKESATQQHAASLAAVAQHKGETPETDAGYVAHYAHHDENRELCKRLERQRDELRAELETERMRLAACGVVATSDTPESAMRSRQMNDEYRSASCDDVARRVDECIELRAENERLRAQIAGMK